MFSIPMHQKTYSLSVTVNKCFIVLMEILTCVPRDKIVYMFCRAQQTFERSKFIMYRINVL
jgi:hypothetical protein